MAKKMVGAVAMLGCSAIAFSAAQSDVVWAKTSAPDPIGESSFAIMDLRGSLSKPMEQRPFLASKPIPSIQEQLKSQENTKSEVDAILQGLLGQDAKNAAGVADSSMPSECSDTAMQQAAPQEETEPVDTAAVEVYGYKSIGLANVHSYLNVRDGASMFANIVGKMMPDSACEIEGYEGDWAKISSGDVRGYVMACYLLTGDDAKNRANYLVNQSVIVNANGLRVRKNAGMNSDVLMTVASGTRLSLADSNHNEDTGVAFANEEVIKTVDENGIEDVSAVNQGDEWLHIQINDHVDGYVSTHFVNHSNKLMTAESTVNVPGDLVAEQASVETIKGLDDALLSKEETKPEMSELKVDVSRDIVADQSTQTNKDAIEKKENNLLIMEQFGRGVDATMKNPDIVNGEFDIRADAKQNDTFFGGVTLRELGLNGGIKINNIDQSILPQQSPLELKDFMPDENDMVVPVEENLEEIPKNEEDISNVMMEEGLTSDDLEEGASNSNGKAFDEASSQGAHYDYTESERRLLAGIIQAEAGNQPFEGKVAVASVVMNRVENERFPNTISDVIYAPNQFTPASTGQLASILASGPSDECMQAATEVLSNDTRNVPNLYFKAAYYAKSHGIVGRQIGDQVFH